jgi:hypothetical protein
VHDLAAQSSPRPASPADASIGFDFAAGYVAGDLASLRRAGSAPSGDESLRAALRSKDRAAVLGAVLAADAAPTPWDHLDALAALAGGWDRGAAVLAVRVAVSISRRLDGDAAVVLEVPDDQLERQAEAWRALARREDRWSDVRVRALEVAARLDRARLATADGRPALVAPLLELAGGTDPQIRRAALELLPVPVPSEAYPALVARLRDEDSATVRLAVAQALCAALPADAAAVSTALGPAGFDAVRAVLATPPADASAALVDAARCLALDPDPRSLRVLARLAHVAPRPVREAVARATAVVRARDQAADR